MRKSILIAVGLLIACTFPALAQATAAVTNVPAPKVDTGDTAWVIMSAALILLMTIPGLALFYGGLVRRKNILNVMMQCFIITAIVSIEWIVCGYSLSFSSSKGALAPFIGGLDWSFLNGIGIGDLSPYFISHAQATGKIVNGAPEMTGTIPHIVYIMYQCMFAVITPAVVIGAFAERINFKGFLVFTLLWSIFVYNPIAHWAWSADGWLAKLGLMDFSGGTVVEINSGITAIVTVLLLGRRRDYQGHAIPPHNIPFVAIGAALLWFGWIGFNAGSGLSADFLAGNAFLTTHMATAVAAAVWAVLDWVVGKKPTVVGICTGAVAGLVAITPANGFVDVKGAMVIGLVAAIICFLMVAFVKVKLGYDDSLDVFGIHGIAGIVGTLFTGLFATPAVTKYFATAGNHPGAGLFYGNAHQFLVQLMGVGATIAFSATGTFILFKLVQLTIGIRATDKEEALGLDESYHAETGYTYFD
ncbi:ammonium transporter [Paludibacter jiangxiensis]|uniref:Ammonium transporter n=1 Tax=Paludibacter jiangxiensis TaxID=681398 RepID=A0A171ACX4_9BACT|nr:ammonium transporter [Paludibacter jiangxiensis]GAT63538.1 ammonium transporter, Amt family [Paludibacter jiangxiensis]